MGNTSRYICTCCVVWAILHVKHLTDMIAGGLRNKGFSFIEALVQCPTSYGRKNQLGDPASMMAWMRDNAVMKNAWDKMSAEEQAASDPQTAAGRTGDTGTVSAA